jgi:hypothetical protein
VVAHQDGARLGRRASHEVGQVAGDRRHERLGIAVEARAVSGGDDEVR